MLTPNSEEWLSQGIGEWNLKCICSEFQLCCLCLIDLFFLCEVVEGCVFIVLLFISFRFVLVRMWENRPSHNL